MSSNETQTKKYPVLRTLGKPTQVTFTPGQWSGDMAVVDFAVFYHTIPQKATDAAEKRRIYERKVYGGTQRSN